MIGYIALILFGTSLTFLWWMWAWGNRDLQIDRTRQEIFEVRDRLFDMAAQGKVSFDAQAYVIARTTFNGLARFTHRLTFAHLVLVIFWMAFDRRYKHQIDLFSKIRAAAIRQLPDEVREEVEALVQQGHNVMLAHLMRTSLAMQTIWQLLRFFNFAVQASRAPFHFARRARRWATVGQGNRAFVALDLSAFLERHSRMTSGHAIAF